MIALDHFWAIELTVLALIAAMCVLIYSVRQNTIIINRLQEKLAENISDDDESEIERFNGEQAEKWFEKGNLGELNKYCEQFFKETPNSVHANWYYALSHYNQGEYEVAREYFENVIRINPLWRDGAVVYLQEIADKIGVPHSRALH